MSSRAEPTRAVAIVDCDVHAGIGSVEQLVPHLPAFWRQQLRETGFRGPQDPWLPLRALAGRRPGRDTLDRVRKAVLGRGGAAVAVLVCDYAVDSLHNPDAAAAFARAVNDWLASDWLDADRRLRASITVCPQYPDLAAREIARRASDRRFVQVLLPVRSEAPYGSRNYRPIFKAAARHGLPVALHAGGCPGNASTPVGWPSFFAEEYLNTPSVFQTQLQSLVANGLFEEFPGLRVVLGESGVTWLPSFLWRFDKNWKGLRREVPWVRRLPSEVVREHVRLTTTPLDAPASSSELAETVDQMDLSRLLLYGSDFPHEHGQARARRGLSFLSPSQREAVLSGNARALYSL
jgi:uncharacterized protein